MYTKRSKLLFAFAFLVLVAGCSSNATPTPTPSPAISETEAQPADSSASSTDTPVPPTAEPSPAETQPTESPPIEADTAPEPKPTEAPAAELEPPNNTWKSIIGGTQEDTLQDVVMTSDGGYLIVGSTNLQFHSDMTSDLYLVRTDANGEVLWEETYNAGGGMLHGQVAHGTEEDGLLISGVISSEDTAGRDIFLMQLDQDRNQVWMKIFGGPLDEFGAAWPTDDGGYLLGGNIVDPDDIVADPGAAGYAGFEGRSNIYLAKVDADGNEIWSQTFGGDQNILATSAALTPDGGFIILGHIMYYPETGDDIYLLKVDADGNEVWSRTWDEGSMFGYSLIETSDGGYLIAGGIDRTDDPTDPLADYLFIKVDADGNEVWLTTFGNPEMTDYGHLVIETSDGGFVAAGDLVTDLHSHDSDISVAKIDQDGEILWQKSIETNTHNMYGKMLSHPDGGFVIGGSTVRRGQFDIFLIKTDAEGMVDD